MSSSCESIFPPDERDNGIGWLEKTQLVLKRMLFILDDVCKKHEIEYFIIGGTLLGAYRTESFIPWDGDVDVGMMENHYNRFCEVVEKELPNDIFFQSKQKEIAGYMRNILLNCEIDIAITWSIRKKIRRLYATMEFN